VTALVACGGPDRPMRETALVGLVDLRCGAKELRSGETGNEELRLLSANPSGLPERRLCELWACECERGLAYCRVACGAPSPACGWLMESGELRRGCWALERIKSRTK
jgi:hypothetical protein